MNPFIYGKPTFGEFFCSRKEQAEIVDALDKKLKVVVYGPSKMGKTSLLKQIENQKGSKFVFLDFKHIQSITDIEKKIIESFLEAETKDVKSILQSYAKYNPTFAIDSLTQEPVYKVTPSGYVSPKDISDALDLYNNFDNSTIVVLDNFQEIETVVTKDQYEEIMNHLLSMPNPWVIVYSSDPNGESTNLEQLKVAVNPVAVSEIEEDTYLKFVKNSINLNDSLIKEGIELAGPITGDRQQLFNALYEVIETDPNSNKNKINQALKLIFDRLNDNFEIVFNDLTLIQKKILKILSTSKDIKVYGKDFAVMVGPTANNTIVKTLQSLAKKKILYKDGKNFKFCNNFFKQWIRSNFKI